MAHADTIAAPHPAEPPSLSPAAHAVLDYAVGGAFLLVGFRLLARHRRAGALALANGALICGAAVITDYPGGLWPRISFRTHRTLDLVQASLAGAGPYLLGFAEDPEASYFFEQAASGMAVIAATEWDGASAGRGPGRDSGG